jgi:hypothetical protein
VAQADQTGSGSPTNDVTQQVVTDVAESLSRRGFFTSEWWTTVIGGALSAVLALLHVSSSSATHVAAVVAPAVLAGLYAIVRTVHKSQLASALAGIFPQAAQSPGQDGQAGAGEAVTGAAAPAAIPAATAPPAAATARAAATPPVSTAVPGAVPIQSQGLPGVAVPAAIAQTDADFEFRGIPPIEDGDG